MLIYLDLCCFNRPFDDQGQLVVRLQTEAKLHVQQAIQHGDMSLAWSAMMDLENSTNPDYDRRTVISGWKAAASVDVDTSPDVETVAEELVRVSIKPMDALHVASAIEAGAAWFLTTDKALLRKMKNDQRIQVADPVDFIRAVLESRNEN